MSHLITASDPTNSSRILIVIGRDRMESLPDDVIQLIFTRLKKTKHFLAFSETCTRMDRISHTIPAYAFECGHLSRFVLIHNIEFNQAAKQLIYERNDELSDAENEFYDTCKKLCFPIGGQIKYEGIPFYMFEAIKALNAIYRKRNINDIHSCLSKIGNFFNEIFNQDATPSENQKLLSDVSMKALSSRLYEKTYNDVVDIIADQLTESVSFDSFKSSAEHLSTIFKSKHSVDIEASLRKALKRKYGKAFNAFAAGFLKLFPPQELFIKIKQLRAPIEAEKAAIEAELAMLLGPSGSDGMINDASMESDALWEMQDEPIDEDRLKRAMDAFREQYKQKYLKDISKRAMRLLAKRIYYSPELENTYKELRNALISPLDDKRRAADSRVEELIHRRDALAQWDESTGILIGGELFEVCKKLEKIEARPMGQFYTHLLKSVTDKNKEARYDSLVALAESWSAN